MPSASTLLKPVTKAAPRCAAAVLRGPGVARGTALSQCRKLPWDQKKHFLGFVHNF